MSARLGSKDAALLVLARAQARDLVWRAGRDVILVTRAGRIVQSAGLPANIRQTWVRDQDPLELHPQRLAQPVEFLRVLDLELRDGTFQTVNLRARISPVGQVPITIYGLRFDTVELVEENKDTGADWRFANRFWVDAETGFTWKSIQTVAPDVPALSTEVLKPAQQELRYLGSTPA